MPLKDILRGLQVIWQFWNWFWFRPISARGVGVMRILLGMVFVMTTVDIWPDRPCSSDPMACFTKAQRVGALGSRGGPTSTTSTP